MSCPDVFFMKGGCLMLSPSFTLSLAESISEVILAPAIQHADEMSHIHVLLDTLQKIRQAHYHTHRDFATGSISGQTYFSMSVPACPFTLDEVSTVLRGNLARQDHDDLNAFYRLIGCPTIDYTYRVGFVLGWLTAVIDHGKAPISHAITHVA
jgi:hypothetical protein